jgi:hypothetical protein
MDRLILTPTNKNVKPSYLQFDNLDDKREIFYLLSKLSPLQRIEFMNWFYSKAHLGPWPALKPIVDPKTVELAHKAMNDSGADERLLLETYLDLWAASNSYSGLNLDIAFQELARLVGRLTR